MGYFSEYISKMITPDQIATERKRQLVSIATLRQRDVLVVAADINKGQMQLPIGIDYSDLLPIEDQLANLSGNKLDLLLETPGGLAEVAEDIVNLLRNKYPDDIAVIIPGWAKSAGTIMTMAADEILMEPGSALGPIDAQLSWTSKTFSADALLRGVDRIKEEVVKSGSLNKAYIPILQGISPGELQKAQNAQDFSKKLVAEWLTKYKFKNWITHSSTGQPVTDADRLARAEEIAEKLRDHSTWMTHGRSLKLADLTAMKLKITDYSKEPQLFEAIRRYFTLLQMTFQGPIYKVFETPTSQIYRQAGPVQMPGAPPFPALPGQLAIAKSQHTCPNCKHVFYVQANLGQPAPLEQNMLPFPQNDKLDCPACNHEINLAGLRQAIESQSGKKIV